MSRTTLPADVDSRPEDQKYVRHDKNVEPSSSIDRNVEFSSPLSKRAPYFLGVTLAARALHFLVTMHARTEFRRLAALLDVKTHPARDITWVIWQLRSLYREIPGLALTLGDVQETVGLDNQMCVTVLGTLVDVGFLRHDERGFVLA